MVNEIRPACDLTENVTLVFWSFSCRRRCSFYGTRVDSHNNSFPWERNSLHGCNLPGVHLRLRCSFRRGMGESFQMSGRDGNVQFLVHCHFRNHSLL